MGKFDKEFIDEFRQKFGDLLLKCDGERRTPKALVDLGDPIVPVHYADNTNFVEATQVPPSTDEALSFLTTFSGDYKLDSPGPYSPTITPKKKKTCHGRNLVGSGAVFHNKAGDLHSPMIQWGTGIPPLFNESVYNTFPSSWDAPRYFCSQNQHLPLGDFNHGQLGYISPSHLHDCFGNNMADELNHQSSTTHMAGQKESTVNSATSQAAVSSASPHDNKELFRYNATLQAPTAMLRSATERAITYLNKSHTYILSVVASGRSSKSVQRAKYKTSIRVAFEHEQQRSDPIASWKLWKEGRGLDEAYKRQGQLTAVEFVKPSQEGADYKDYQHIRLEKSYIDGFCITWTADPERDVHRCTIPLKFHFLSTDFSRSKGVKGVPLRLYAKTSTIQPDGGMESREHDSEMCFCIIKLFRDHGAERKMSNDVAHIMRRIEKLKQKIGNKEQGADFPRPIHSYNSMDSRRASRGVQKQKMSKGLSKSHPHKGLHVELALMHEMLQSARQMSVLSLRGEDKDDPDLFPIPLSLATDAADSEDRGLQQQNGTSRSSTSREPERRPQKRYLKWTDYRCSRHQLENPKFDSEAPKQLSTPARRPSQAVACFYVRFIQYDGFASRLYHPLYLESRTLLELQEKLAEKLQMDSGVIARIFWENRKGIKVLIDDDVVRYIPEAQTMTASICENLHTEMAFAGSERSPVAIKLEF